MYLGKMLEGNTDKKQIIIYGGKEMLKCFRVVKEKSIFKTSSAAFSKHSGLCPQLQINI